MQCSRPLIHCNWFVKYLSNYKIVFSVVDGQWCILVGRKFFRRPEINGPETTSIAFC